MAFNPAEHFINLKGKDYLQVMWRLVWFREEHPDYGILTELISHDTEHNVAVFKCEIVEPHTEQVIATGHGSESIRDFKDYLEKAETKAIGRALAILGYGTQFAPELDEGERIVDSPVAKKATAKDLKQRYESASSSGDVCEDCGKLLEEYKDKNGNLMTVAQHIEFSKNYCGKQLCRECIKKWRFSK